MPHINEDKIIVSIIDINDLSNEDKNHLLSCDICKEARQTLEHELNQINVMARKFLPARQCCNVTLPEKSRQGLFIVHPAIIAFSLLIIAVIWFPSPAKLYKEYTDNLIIEKALADRDIRGVIQELNEQLLTDMRVDFSENPDSYVNEDFMKFIVPVSIQEDSAGQVNDPVKKN
ncbi:MAG: hypothetical protein HQK91_13620 [Nitrospirae bacterium]|nr:hypothetical protein [Nitrospirota bacterium]MBF0542476.1 hypothetical protein [Nitrospirota bacterium]